MKNGIINHGIKYLLTCALLAGCLIQATNANGETIHAGENASFERELQLAIGFFSQSLRRSDTEAALKLSRSRSSTDTSIIEIIAKTVKNSTYSDFRETSRSSFTQGGASKVLSILACAKQQDPPAIITIPLVWIKTEEGWRFDTLAHLLSELR